MAAVLLVCFVKRGQLSDDAVLGAAVLLAIGIPFLLPHMHDRYFFCADILSLVLAFAAPWSTAAALLVQFASLLGLSRVPENALSAADGPRVCGAVRGARHMPCFLHLDVFVKKIPKNIKIRS